MHLLGRALQQTESIVAARPCCEEALNIFTELGAPEADEVRVRLAEDAQALGSNT